MFPMPGEETPNVADGPLLLEMVSGYGIGIGRRSRPRVSPDRAEHSGVSGADNDAVYFEQAVFEGSIGP